MKIKRFEGSNMSEALRMIKKEFGEDAVILSAKTMKKSGGLLSGKRAKKVVVTAAIDHIEVEKETAAVNAENHSNRHQTPAPVASAVSATSRYQFLKNYKPITKTGRKKVKPKIVQFMAESDPPEKSSNLVKQLRDQDISPTLACELAEQIHALMQGAGQSESDPVNALSQALDAMRLVRRKRNATAKAPRIVAMVGPSGTGKTSALVKLAAAHIIEKGERVGIISLDNQRIAAAGELKRYADIMRMPFAAIDHSDAIDAALSAMATMDMIVVDTPALALQDHTHRNALNQKLEQFPNLEPYLVLSAADQEGVMARAIAFFKPLGIMGLVFSKMDWALACGPLVNQSLANELPIAYLCDSPKIPEGLHKATVEELAAILLPAKHVLDQKRPEENTLTLRQRALAKNSDCYVANRNSDIFHHAACKSVKRINADNMVIFKNPAEAMGRQFKPCRMCCSDYIVAKPVERQAKRYA